MAAVHASPFAGSWYPGSAAELDLLLDELFEKSAARNRAALPRDPLALLVPHAGLRYSGTVAAAAYRALAASRPRRIVLLGFSHRGGPPGVAIPDLDTISTPVGDVMMDRETASHLSAPPFALTPERCVCDHSVEIQLPLLLRAAPGVPVLPLYVGPLEAAAREAAAHALAGLLTPGTVLLASSDLTHYGSSFRYVPFPPDDRFHDRMRALDFGALDAAGSLDPGLFLDYLAESGSTVCGDMPIVLLMRALALASNGDIYQEVLDYQTSAEITGELEHSVSYAATVFCRAGSFELLPADCGLLLKSAHATLRHLFETGDRRPIAPQAITAGIARRAGVFVSLHEGGELRGCVGNRSAVSTLAEAVPELTLSAALDDLRFRPLRDARRPVEIEISVLTPLRLLPDAAGFVLGRHGVYLENGHHRALLLPQVARDRDWTPEQFLGALARKAGLPPDDWSRPGTRLHVFEAQVFSTALEPPG